MQGAIKQSTVSRLSERQPSAGKWPSGTEGAKEGGPFLSSGESRTGGRSFKRDPDGQPDFAGGDMSGTGYMVRAENPGQASGSPKTMFEGSPQ